MIRRGYTLIELMIALALLGALMALAWSMLGSYRQAEQRGWEQSYRMQLVRAAREMLEDDIDHLAALPPKIGFIDEAAGPLAGKGFRGTSTGFSAEIVPSIDPLPWLERIAAFGDEGTQGGGELAGGADDERGVGSGKVAPRGPLDRATLRYSLEPFAESAEGDPVANLRRELNAIRRPRRGSELGSDPQRRLDASDLYRSSGDGVSGAGDAAEGRELTTVRRLANPRFRYSDGRDWMSQWDEASRGGLPRAIELSFDLVMPGDSLRGLPAETDAGGSGREGDGPGEASTGDPQQPLGASEASLDGESLTGEAAQERDVRIVIRVQGGVVNAVPPPLSGGI